jgi:hypothetical protein
MRAKFSLAFGVIFTAGLVIAHKSFAQANDRLAAKGIAASPSPNVSLVPASPLPDWERRFLEIANQPDLQQEELRRELAATVPEYQIPDALYKLAMLQSDSSMTLVVLLGQRWAEKSPADAAQWAATHMSDDLFGRNLFAKIMVPWAGKDLAGAAAWLQKMPAGGNKTAAVVSLATEAAGLKEPIIAINLTTNLPSGPERDDLLNYAAQQWAATDRDDAVAWINKLQDPVLRGKILGEIAINLGAQDPAAGAKFAATAMPDGKDRDSAMGTVIRFWGASAPAAAAAWVEQCPDGPLRDLAMENLMDTWAKNNLAEARQWLNKLQAGHSRDIAANALARQAK